MKKLTRRTFFKGLTATVLLGALLPWLKKTEEAVDEREYPLLAKKEPRAVASKHKKISA